MAIPADPALKEKARALYYQGLSWPEIAAQTGANIGTLRVWGTREMWVKTKNDIASNRLKTLLKPDGTALQPTEQPNIDLDLQHESRKIRKSLVNELNSQLAVLEREPCRRAAQLSGRDGRAATVRSIVDAAKTVLGWDADSGKSLVQVNILAAGPDGVTFEKEPKQV